MKRRPSNKRKKPVKQAQRPQPSRPRREWLGDRVALPAIQEPHEPAEAFVWLEQPDGVLVAFHMLGMEGSPVSVAESLLEAMSDPEWGEPRAPGRVRVASRALATELTSELPDMKVKVAPTPEIDEFIQGMADEMRAEHEAASYFEDGTIRPGLVERLFQVAAELYRMAPWRVANNAQLIGLDIPELGLEDACVSILGSEEETYGFVIFLSLPDYWAFVDMAENLEEGEIPPGMGASTLALHFDDVADLRWGLRQEATQHAWPVASTSAYPWILRLDVDGQKAPVSPYDVRVITACATALCGFFAAHPDLFDNDSSEPVCESYLDSSDIEVHLSVPPELLDDLELEDAKDDPDARIIDDEETLQMTSNIVKSYKFRHYAEWVDEPLPALNGDTPRKAVRSKAGRIAVEQLLHDFAEMESRLEQEQRFDFAPIRRELGLGD